MTRRTLIASFFWLLPAVWAAEAGRYDVTVEIGVRAAMRDGTLLVADVYQPDAKGKYPVLLQRTPYNRKGGRASGRLLASHGYIVVIQDVRGRYDSEGEWYPFKHESADGYDTVEWAAKLPGSDGRVGMFGGSYVGATQMLAAIAKPPHLEAVFPYVTASEYYDGWTYQGGVLMQWFTQTWTSGLARDTVRRKVSAGLTDWRGSDPSNFPVLRVPEGSKLAPYYFDWVNNWSDDEYWKPWKISDHYPELEVKALHAGGWYDIFLKGTLKNYIGLRQSAKTEEARQGQRLLIGPWAHTSTSPEGRIGGFVFGKQAVLDMNAAILEWYDWVFKGKKNDYAKKPPVKIFVMGDNVWRYENEFPLERQRLTRYYLHSSGRARTVSGDGALSLEKPGEEPPDRFRYDPDDPVGTIGGRLCCANNFLQPGPFDQSPNEFRRDVLVYSTPPLSQDIEVTGFIKVELYAATTARDPHFTAMLVDVSPEGYARLITDGIIRAALRNGFTRAEEVEPGRIYRYEIDLWATSNVFKKGHRIRLYVSSSNFPRFARAPETATQTIYHDAEHPSALLLPVIPR